MLVKLKVDFGDVVREMRSRRAKKQCLQEKMHDSTLGRDLNSSDPPTNVPKSSRDQEPGDAYLVLQREQGLWEWLMGGNLYGHNINCKAGIHMWLSCRTTHCRHWWIFLSSLPTTYAVHCSLHHQCPPA